MVASIIHTRWRLAFLSCHSKLPHMSTFLRISQPSTGHHSVMSETQNIRAERPMSMEATAKKGSACSRSLSLRGDHGRKSGAMVQERIEGKFYDQADIQFEKDVLLQVQHLGALAAIKKSPLFTEALSVGFWPRQVTWWAARQLTCLKRNRSVKFVFHHVKQGRPCQRQLLPAARQVPTGCQAAC